MPRMRRVHRWRRYTPAVCALLLALGCRCRQSDTAEEAGARAPAASRGAAAASVRVPDFAPGPPAQPSELAKDALWKDAQRRQPIDLQRLANREGAAGLLRGVELGGSLGLAALAALPYADDGELALGRLCEITRAGGPARLEPVLRAVHGVVSRPPKQAERLDLDGYRQCASALDQIKGKAGLSLRARDLALSARAMLAEHGIGK